MQNTGRMVLNTNLGAIKDYSHYEDEDQYMIDEEEDGRQYHPNHHDD